MTPAGPSNGQVPKQSIGAVIRDRLEGRASKDTSIGLRENGPNVRSVYRHLTATHTNPQFRHPPRSSRLPNANVVNRIHDPSLDTQRTRQRSP